MPWALRRCWKHHNELGAVVFNPETRRLWQPLTQRIKGDGRLAAGLGGGEGDGKAGVGVDKGEQAAAQAIARNLSTASLRISEQTIAQAIARAHHGIAGEHFKRKPLGLRGMGLWCAGIQSSGGMAHFVRVAGDDAADGGDIGQRDVLLPTPRSQQDPQFGFSEVGELLSQLADLPHRRRWRLWLSQALGGAGFGSQGGRVAAGLAHCFQRYRVVRLKPKASPVAASP